MRIRTSTLALALFVLSLFVFAADGKRLITEKDLWQFRWVADPRVSPDGSQVVYAEVTVDKKRTGYETSLWVVPTQGNAAPRPPARMTRSRAGHRMDRHSRSRARSKKMASRSRRSFICCPCPVASLCS